MKTSRFLAVALGLLALRAEAAVITFEDLTTRNSFNNLGITDSYQGFEWGYGWSAGVAGRTWANSITGWASGTQSNSAVSPVPNGLQGQSYAWNWDGPTSLWIDFQSAVNFDSGLFATLSPSFGSNASSVQLFGYDAADNLVAFSSVLNLSDTFQTLDFDVSVQQLEIRGSGGWFSIDNLTYNEASQNVPDGSSSALLSVIGLVTLIAAKRRRRA